MAEAGTWPMGLATNPAGEATGAVTPGSAPKSNGSAAMALPDPWAPIASS